MIRSAFFVICMGVATMSSLAQTNTDIRVAKERTLKRLTYDWQAILPEWETQFNGGRRGHLGNCDSETRVIDIWVRADQTQKMVAKTLVHEFAHAFDYQYMTWEMRREWLSLRGRPNAKWYPSSRAKNDYDSGAGDFAESVSWTFQGHGTFRGRLGPPPNAKQRALLKKWIADAAAMQLAAK